MLLIDYSRVSINCSILVILSECSSSVFFILSISVVLLFTSVVRSFISCSNLFISSSEAPPDPPDPS
jgi:hypothetical protein